MFVILGGFRWNTGADWMPYSNFYTKSDTEDPYFMLAMESGFATLVKFLRLFSNSFTFYLCVLSLACVALKAVFLYRYTNAVFLALILFWAVALGDIIAVRQSLAISLCAISAIYIVDRKPLLFALFVFLALQIHITAILFFLAYPIYHWNWSVKSKVICLLIAILFGLFVGSEKILSHIISFVPSGIGLERISQKAESYMSLGNEMGGKQNVSKFQRTVAALAKRAIILPVFFFFQHQLSKSSTTFKGFLNLYTFGNILYFIFIDFLTLQRSATYFYFFEIILFCIIFDNVKSKTVWFSIIMLYALLKLISLVLASHNLIVPYIWIFSEDTFRFEH